MQSIDIKTAICNLITNKYEFSRLLDRDGLFEDETYVIKGLTQIGKTAMIIDYAIYSYLKLGKALIILRNFTEDLVQINTRLNQRIKEIYSTLAINEKDMPIRVILNTQKNKKNKKLFDLDGIFVILGNTASIKAYKKLPNKSYTCFIDEADFQESGKSNRACDLSGLKARSKGCFLVSATMLDSIGLNDILPKNIIVVPRSPHYKGIESFNLVFEIPDNAVFTKGGGDMFADDPSFMPFLKLHFSKLKHHRYVGKSGMNMMPNICLVNATDKKRPMYKAQKFLQTELPCLDTIVYTGDGISVSLDGQDPVILNISFSECLQKIKDECVRSNKEPRNILVFAGDLAARGVSFVSADYEWHINYLRIISTLKRVLCECIQQVGRLTGNFNDNIPLNLCCTSVFKQDIYYAHALQEDILVELKKNELRYSTKSCKLIVQDEFVGKYITTMTRTKGLIRVNGNEAPRETGFNEAVYAGTELPPAEFFDMYSAPQPSNQDKRKYTAKRTDKEEKERDKWLATLDTCLQLSEFKIDEPEQITSYVLISPENLDAEYTEAYNAVLEVIEHNYLNGWVLRSTIATSMKTSGMNNKIITKLNKIHEKGVPCDQGTRGMVFKKEGEKRWRVRLA